MGTEEPSAAAPAAPEVLTSPIVSLLGDVLKAKPSVSETGVATSTISGPNKVLGLYFSAHWCPPCRMFTPMLAKFYTNFKSSHARKDDLEIVFVSSDRDQGAFDGYFAEMPWLALPFADRGRKAELSRKFKVQGIPTLVFLDGHTGKVITAGGRDKVLSDPSAEDFPWLPKPFSEVLGAELVDAAGSTRPAAEALAGKITLLYFSAHWCPPCKRFTPELAKVYDKLKAEGKQVEAVFVSGDHDEDQFKEYLATMPWLAVPYSQKKIRTELNNMYDVEGIPTLVVLDEEGKVITTNGRSAVGGDPEGAEFPWQPKPVEQLSSANVSLVNDQPVLFFTGTGDIKEQATQLLQPIAQAHKAAVAAGTIEEDIAFVYASADDPTMKKILDFAQVKAPSGDAQLLWLLNIPEQGKWVSEEGAAVTAEVVQGVVARVVAGSLELKPLRDDE